eukprot:TRINITY_DN15725_c0_g1_i1.p1 TRINITY_DN15725_c0_g1~~TRINITY_DN15725_c0_g1_i1.p1  ORF type:complete len:2211 (+),score=838.20 TRINITY_DN15725_c0_g1_i1:50-6634(+)
MPAATAGAREAAQRRGSQPRWAPLALALALICGLALASFAHGFVVHRSVSGVRGRDGSPAAHRGQEAATDGYAHGGGREAADDGVLPSVSFVTDRGLHSSDARRRGGHLAAQPTAAPWPQKEVPVPAACAAKKLPKKLPPCQAGELVRAEWAGDRRRYRAVLRSVGAGGRATVDWCDGSASHRTMPLRKVGCKTRPAGPRQPPGQEALEAEVVQQQLDDDEPELSYDAYRSWAAEQRKKRAAVPPQPATPQPPPQPTPAPTPDAEVQQLEADVAKAQEAARRDSVVRQLRERLARMRQESEESAAWAKEEARERERDRERQRERWSEMEQEHLRWRRSVQRSQRDAMREEAEWADRGKRADKSTSRGGSEQCPGMAVPPVPHYADALRQMTNPQYAYATFVTSSDFVMPAAVLMHSVAVSGCSYARVIAVTDDVSRNDRELLSYFGQVVLIKKIGAPRFVDNPRYRDTFTKLRIWQLTRWKKIFYIDTDVIVLRNMDDVFDLKEWSVPYDAMHDRYSTGMMLIEPSLDTFNDMMERLTSTTVSMELPDLLFLKEYFEWKGKKINIISRWYQVYQEEFGAYHQTYLTEQKSTIKIYDPRVHGIHYPGANKPFNNVEALQSRWGHLLCDWADRADLAYEPHFLWLWAHALMRRDLASMRSVPLFSHEQAHGGVVIDMAAAVEEDEAKRKEEASRASSWTPPTWTWDSTPAPTDADSTQQTPAPWAAHSDAPSTPQPTEAPPPRFRAKSCSVGTPDGAIDLTRLDPVQFSLKLESEDGTSVRSDEDYQWVLTWCTQAQMAPEGTRECLRPAHIGMYSWGFCRSAFDRAMTLRAMDDGVGAVLRAEAGSAEGPRRVFEAHLHCSLEPGYHDVWLNSTAVRLRTDGNSTQAPRIYSVHLQSPCFCPGVCTANDTTTDLLNLPAPGSRTRSDGRCGSGFPTAAGTPAECDPLSRKDLTGPCCSDKGYCGLTAEHCACSTCVDYSVVYAEAMRREREAVVLGERLSEVGEKVDPVRLHVREGSDDGSNASDAEALFQTGNSSAPEEASGRFAFRADGERCDAWTKQLQSAAECSAAAQQLGLVQRGAVDSDTATATSPCNTHNPRGCYVNAKTKRLYWNPCGDPLSAAPRRMSVCSADTDPLSVCLVDNNWRTAVQVLTMAVAEKREAIAAELDALALRMGWPVAEHDAKSAEALAALCPTAAPGAVVARTPAPVQTGAWRGSLLPSPDAGRRQQYVQRRRRRLRAEREYVADYARAETRAGELLGEDYEARLAERRQHRVQEQAGDAARRAAGIDRADAAAEEGGSAEEVVFVDGDGDTIVVGMTGDSVHYSVNGDRRPPSRELDYHPDTGELRFVDARKAVTIPEEGRQRILARIRRLAVAADVQHNLPVDGPWQHQVTVAELQAEKDRAVHAEDYGDAARLTSEIRRRRADELADLVALKQAAVAREDFETATRLRDSIRQLNATITAAEGGDAPKRGANFTVGATVVLLKRAEFKGGKTLPAGARGVVEKVPGKRNGSPATVRIRGTLFDLRPGQAEVVSAARANRTRTAAVGPTRTLRVRKDSDGKIGVTFSGGRVLNVRAGSPAADAGLASGSTLVRVDGVAVQTTGDVREALAAAPPAFDVTVAEPEDVASAPRDVLGDELAPAAPETPPPPPVVRRKSPTVKVPPVGRSAAPSGPANTTTTVPNATAVANATAPEVQKEGQVYTGQRVRFRDRGQEWRKGIVAQVRPDGAPLVAIREGGVAFTWDEVESDEGPCPAGDLSACLARCQQPEDAAKLRDCIAECVRVCPEAQREKAEGAAPAASRDAALRQGDRVRVDDAFRSNSRDKVLLERGWQGAVVAIDRDGDALVHFEGSAQRQWVFARNFGRLRRLDECSEVNATAAAALGFGEGAVPLSQVRLPLPGRPAVTAVVPFGGAGNRSGHAHVSELLKLLDNELAGVTNLTVVDVGAASGAFTLAAAALGATVHTVEPLELNVLALRCGLRLLPAAAAASVTVHAVGLAGDGRSDCVALSPTAPSKPSTELAVGEVAVVRCGDRRVEAVSGLAVGGTEWRVRDAKVRADRGDATLGRRRVHVLRVSTGGMEAEALRGLAGVFDGPGVDFAVVEVSGGRDGPLHRNAADAWAFFAARQYDVTAGGFGGAAVTRAQWDAAVQGGTAVLYARRRSRAFKRRQAATAGAGSAPRSERKGQRRVLRR